MGPNTDLSEQIIRIGTLLSLSLCLTLFVYFLYFLLVVRLMNPYPRKYRKSFIDLKLISNRLITLFQTTLNNILFQTSLAKWLVVG